MNAVRVLQLAANVLDDVVCRLAELEQLLLGAEEDGFFV
jgi:hypothetical protein